MKVWQSEINEHSSGRNGAINKHNKAELWEVLSPQFAGLDF